MGWKPGDFRAFEILNMLRGAKSVFPNAQRGETRAIEVSTIELDLIHKAACPACP